MTIQDSMTQSHWFPGPKSRSRYSGGRMVRTTGWIAAIFILSILATTAGVTVITITD